MDNKKIKDSYELLKDEYGDEYAWKEVREILDSESKDVNIDDNALKDPFKNLIIGVLSQNTSDWNSTRAYIGLKRKVGEVTPGNIANFDIDELKEAIRPGGLYNMKSERLQKLADYILQRYSGDLSKITQLSREEAREELLKMPGIGQKTADVFLSECLNYGTLAVDTHIFRISKRLGFVSEDSDYGEVKEILEGAIEPFERLKAHQLFIRLGRDYCKARNPKCDECPLEEKCEKNL